ncbi:hypothetical protein [Anaerococcus tetradius]|uniref:hypothetical protein n=1 Tax=Anaerococcus tetradius TaxID=33036 RepID=UPI0023EFFE26|nr:hypothetical protein [Anaerococcus tetradius]
MKKWEVDRLAYYYAKELLPGHIEDLKRQLGEEKDEYKQVHLSTRIDQAEEAMAEVPKMYDKICNR